MSETILEPGQKECFICGRVNPMFTWSSSRHFPRQHFAQILFDDTGVELRHILIMLKSGVPVCIVCRGKII